RGELERVTERSLASFDLGPLGVDGSMPDTLVVHDRADKETPYRVGAQIASGWPNARLHSTEGLGHQRILADPVVVDEAIGHLTRRAPVERGR
uniref:alpha/beta hydrolase n=1 Tax=Actinotalea sp. TaxID=1872145 RepID=UPI0035694087